MRATRRRWTGSKVFPRPKFVTAPPGPTGSKILGGVRRRARSQFIGKARGANTTTAKPHVSRITVVSQAVKNRIAIRPRLVTLYILGRVHGSATPHPAPRPPKVVSTVVEQAVRRRLKTSTRLGRPHGITIKAPPVRPPLKALQAVQRRAITVRLRTHITRTHVFGGPTAPPSNPSFPRLWAVKSIGVKTKIFVHSEVEGDAQ